MAAWLCSGGKPLDAGRDHPPDFNGLAVLRANFWIGRIGGEQFDAACALIQLLDREFAVHHGHHDLPVAWLEGFVDHQRVAIKDARLPHGLAADSQQKGGLRVGDQFGREVNPVDRKVFGGRGEPG